MKKRDYPKRFIPRGKPQPYRLQPEDLDLLKLLHDYRILEARQMAPLVRRSVGTAQDRLRLMFDDQPRLVTKPPKQYNALRDPGPDAYALANAGADVLAEKGIIERGKRDWSRLNREIGLRYIEHTMMVTNFRVCLTLALRDSDRCYQCK